MKVGDYMRVYHNSLPFYARVEKINRVHVRVRTEAGDVKLVRREYARANLIPADDWHPEIPASNPEER